MKKTIDDLSLEDQEKFKYISLLFLDGIKKCIVENQDVFEDEETPYFFFLASKEFFNLFHGIVTTEMVWKLESTEDPKLLDKETIEFSLVDGNKLTFKAALPPQGTWNGEYWHGIVDLKSKMGI